MKEYIKKVLSRLIEFYVGSVASSANVQALPTIDLKHWYHLFLNSLSQLFNVLKPIHVLQHNPMNKRLWEWGLFLAQKSSFHPRFGNMPCHFICSNSLWCFLKWSHLLNISQYRNVSPVSISPRMSTAKYTYQGYLLTVKYAEIYSL